MQTHLADFIKDTPEGQEAEAIVRTCVHCGFCLATCPTYQLLGDELDSPRGRIYLMKQMLEGAPVTRKTQLHLDRCLTCRACETVCPSGVKYGRLVDIGRGLVEKKVGRGAAASSMRYALRRILPNPGLFAALLKRFAMGAGCWCWRGACSPRSCPISMPPRDGFWTSWEYRSSVPRMRVVAVRYPIT